MFPPKNISDIMKYSTQDIWLGYNLTVNFYQYIANFDFSNYPDGFRWGVLCGIRAVVGEPDEYDNLRESYTEAFGKSLH